MKIANVLISNAWGEVGLDSLEEGIGGREGALIYLSQQWAANGHEVTSFVNCEKGTRFKEPYIKNDVWIGGEPLHAPGYHEYIPLNMVKGMFHNFPWDVIIAWECPSIFKDEKTVENVKLKVCEMQVAHLNNAELRAANKCLDIMCGLSDWHCEFLIHQGLELPRDRVVTLPNGINNARYQGTKIKTKPGKNWKFVYSSSPDRGLSHLLRAWPEIRKLNANAELRVAYGVKNWTEQVKYSHGRVAEMAIEIEELITQPGIKDLGKIGQGKLSKLQINADAWLYPFDPIQSTETGCITAIENAAAGNPLITTDADCMESEFGGVGRIVDLPFSVDTFVGAIEEVMTDTDKYQEMQQAGFKLAKSRDWSDIAVKWLDMFEREVK